MHGAAQDGAEIVRIADAIEREQLELAVLGVRDNGTGIDPQNLRRIFDPFFTTKRQGTGLGLAISRQIIEETGGELSVASELGVGTRFTVSWPTQPAR